MKKIIMLSVLLLMLTPFFFPICDAEEYYFEEMEVLIIGRCRTTVHPPNLWSYGLHVGNLSFCNVIAGRGPLQKIYVKTTNFSFPLLKYNYCSVHMRNASGIFFWGVRKPLSVSWIPPLVFVRCYADKITVEAMIE